MNKFKKWHGRSVDEGYTSMSEEAKSFVRQFKNFLKRNFPDATLDGFTAGHYFTSGFLTQNGVCVYISYDIPRYNTPLDFCESGARFGVLYRLAKNTKDYTGGPNNFSSMFELVENLQAFIKKNAGNGVAA